MNARTSLFLCSLLTLASWQALACYTVYDPKSRVMYRSTEAPVDMSRPLHETLPQRFPGGQLVFDNDNTCPNVALGSVVVPPPGASPLLTDRRTADELHVPYTVLGRNIVVVSPRNSAIAMAGRPSGIDVFPRQALVAAAVPKRSTVITELRDPPMTIVEGPDGVTVSSASR